MYDIAIIGLGPAGAMLASLLNSDFKIAAIDRKSSPATEGGFQKPCGGLLAPDAQKALARFNLTLPKEVLVDPQIFTVRTLDIEADVSRNYQRFYLNMDRHKFDLWLKSLIKPTVDCYHNARCEWIRCEGNGYQIQFWHDGIQKQIAAKYIVGADGANSLVRRLLYGPLKMRKYIAIQQWFKETHCSPFYSCVFDSEVTDCYAWTISKDGYFIFGGAFPADDPRKKFDALKSKLETKGFQFGDVLKTEACVVLRPARFGDMRCGRDHGFLIGEAAAMISPSSLEGISHALNSAYELSRVLNSGGKNPNGLYRRKTLKLRLKIFIKIIKCAFMYHPLLRRVIMKSGIKSIPVTAGGGVTGGDMP